MPLFPFGPDVIIGLSYYEKSPVEKNIPVTLDSVSINAVVVHSAARVDIRQKYVYTGKENGEGAYIFPLVPAITVTQFRVEVNGQIRKGVVKANEEAKKQYINALEEHRMNLLREVGTDEEIFNIDIGSMEPNDSIIVCLSYITELRNEIGTNSVKFIIPKTVAPNYNTEGNGVNSSKVKSSANVAIKVTVSIEGHLAKLESPSHNVSISKIEPVPEKICWTRAFVDAGAKAKDMNRDFVLLITPEEVDRPRVYSEQTEDKSMAVMVHFTPRLESDEQNVELIVALDRSSANIEGDQLKTIELALLTFLHSIPVDAYFNIVGFGHKYKFLFHESVQYDQDSLSKAVAHIKNIPATVDDTHLYDLLQVIYHSKPIDGHLRQVFLLTGSQISNAGKFITLVHSHCHNTRVFALGIGEEVSESLVYSIAKAGRGSAQFVTGNESIDNKLLDQLKISLQPCLTEITVKWSGVTKPMGIESHQAPDRVPPIFNGFPVIIYGVFADEIPTGISISANSPDGMRSVKIPIDEERDTGDLGLITKVAAMKVIRELEKNIGEVSEMLTCCGQGNGNNPAFQITAYQQRIKDTIIFLGCGYGIVSKYTSYVMIDESKITEDFHGTIQQRNIPLQKSSCKKSLCCINAEDTCLDYIGEDRPNNDGLPGPSRSCTHGSPVAPQNSLGESDLRALLDDYNSVPLRFSKSLCAKKSENIEKFINVDSFRQELDIDGFRDDLSTIRSTSRFNLFNSDAVDDDEYRVDNIAKNPVHDIANLQAYSGSFQLTNDLCAAISISELFYLELEARNKQWDETAWATALALVFMSTKLTHLKRSWGLIALKSEKWLINNHPDTYQAMMTAAWAAFD